MKIAIIGNGQSALTISSEKLLDKDIIVRLKLGAVKTIYNRKDIIKKEHHIILHPYNLKKMSQEEVNLLMSLYKKIFFISYLFSGNILRNCTKDEFEEKILTELNFKIDFNKDFMVLNFFDLYREYICLAKNFNEKFYYHIEKIINSGHKVGGIIPTRQGLFTSSRHAQVRDSLCQLLSYVKKHNNKEFLFYPSVGFTAILTYIHFYPQAKIYLYGYDFNNDSGWFWSKEHKHNKMTHNFAYEKEFILKNQLFSNVIIE